MWLLEKGAQSPKFFNRQGSGSFADPFTPASCQHDSNEKASKFVVQCFWLGGLGVGFFVWVFFFLVWGFYLVVFLHTSFKTGQQIWLKGFCLNKKILSKASFHHQHIYLHLCTKSSPVLSHEANPTVNSCSYFLPIE